MEKLRDLLPMVGAWRVLDPNWNGRRELAEND